MSTFLNAVFNGLSLGSIYALITIGFVVIYKASGVVNFAQGSLLLLGGYVVARLHESLGFGLALAVGAAAAALAAVVQALILRVPRRADHATLAILTIGFDVLMTTDLVRRIGSTVYSLGDPWGSATVEMLGITVPQTRVASLVVAVVLIAALFAAFQWTRWGLALRASTQDREAIALMGVNLGRLQLSAWAIAGALCAIAAVFMVSFPTAGLDRSTGYIAAATFPAAIIGGMDSAPGALLGSLIVGFTSAIAVTYQQQLSFLGDGAASALPYLVMVLVLVLRPQGLLGSKETYRV